MDPRLNTELQHLDGVDIRWDVPRTDYTTWHVGGPATSLIRPLHLAGLQRAVRVLNPNTYPFFALGRSSDLLLSHAGARGAAITLEQAFERCHVKLEIQVPGHEVKV
jgi:UDP-N-acetylmuramate dehydrogenase